MNAATLGRVGRLHDPDVSLRLRLAQLLVVSVEVVELLRQDVSVGDEIVLTTPKTLLHLHVIVAKPILASDLITHGEVIDLLELIETLVEVTLAGAGRPQDIPLVRVSVAETVCFED